MKILLPIDGSVAAYAAVRFVSSLAKDNPIDAIVLMVSYDPFQYTMQPWVSEWTEQEDANVKRILESAKELLEVHCRSVSMIHGRGHVAPRILENARNSAVDLIVMGAMGHSTLHRVFLGSVSDTIANRAECSVVVVRPTEKNDHHMHRILLAYDKSIASRESVAELMNLKLKRDTQVDVVSVAQNPYVFVSEGYPALPLSLTSEQIAPITETAERMASQIAEHFPHTDAQILVADHVGHAIVEAAQQGKADVIVVGDSGQSWLGEFFLGSTSKYVLRHAPCSVWISRHHWKAESAEQTAAENTVTSS
jgi:nucleotide-binding universal stress UspA family protein